MKLRSVLLAATILAAPLVAKADPIDGLYVGAGAGFNYLSQTDIKGFQPDTSLLGFGSPAQNTLALTGTAVGHGKLSYQGGFVGLGSIGWGLGNGLRFELEGNYRYNKVNHWSGTPFPTSGHGENETFGPMVNAFYDFDMGWPVIPYLGVGVGYGWTDLQNVSSTSTYNPTIPGLAYRAQTNKT